MIADKGTVRVPQQQRQRPDAFGPDVLAALEKITVGGSVSVGELTDRIDRSRISCEVSTDAAQPMTARACGPFPLPHSPANDRYTGINSTNQRSRRIWLASKLSSDGRLEYPSRG
uniref:Uncharacterized protein n=1 Tax=Anopheles merus TaxID=30066 RepID=A0A182V113_ANOME